MESAKLKNIVLLILVITNALLLCLLLVQGVQSRQYRQQALADAIELLAQRGISVQTQDIPTADFPASMTLERDEGWELEVFTELLGQGTTLTQRGLVSLYTGPLGTAEVRENGGFSISFATGAYPLAPEEDAVSHAQALVQRLGFPTAGEVRTEDGGVSLIQTCAGGGGRYPVFSCAVQVEYENGQAVSLRGTRLVGRPSPDAQQGEALSTATLLVRFRSGIIDSGDACTAIRSATQGYVLSADAGGNLRLTPVLRLETDTNPYVVNALTGELSRG